MLGVHLKLNIGCHEFRLKGYVNIDMIDGDAVDVVADARKLPYKDNFVDEVYASHILEHFPHTQTKKVLDEWYRVLKNGGKLKVSVPSFEIMLHVISLVGITKWVFDMLWGNQDDEYGFHYVCFSRELLVKNLRSVGFRNIEVVEKLNKNSKDRSTSVVVSSDKRINGIPISLNVVAEK